MPYAALFGPDPVPDRAHIFFVAMHQQIEGAPPQHAPESKVPHFLASALASSHTIPPCVMHPAAVTLLHVSILE